MKLERLITIFDNASEEVIGEINIGHITLDTLKNLFRPPSDDPLMYRVYEISETQAEEINKYMHHPIDFNLQERTYYVECVQLSPSFQKN